MTENGRRKQRRVYTEAMSEDDIKTELDQIFEDLGHKEGEYPFRRHVAHGWGHFKW